MTARKRYKEVGLEKVEYALPQQIRNYTNMISKVETVSKMYTFVSVLSIVLSQGREDSKFDLTSISIFLYGSDDLDGAFRLLLSIPSFDYFAESALSKKFRYLVCHNYISHEPHSDCIFYSQRSPIGVCSFTM